MFFFFQFLYIVDYIYWFCYFEPSFSDKEAFLIMMDDPFSMFLDFVFKYLIEYFFIYVHKEN